MQTMNSTNKYILSGIATLMLLAAFVFIAPAKVHAFGIENILDPGCLFICDEPELPPVPRLPGLPGFTGTNTSGDMTRVVNNTYTNSNNVNSNVNSPNGTVTAVNTAVDTSGRGSISQTSYGTPTYNYNDDDTNYHQPNYGSLQVNCYPLDMSVDEGDVVRWQATAYGGNGSYNYTWTGTNGLSGSGSSISKRYSSEGYKSATVRVRSGTQDISRNCDGTVYVNAEDHYNNDDYDYNDDHNYNNYPTAVSCTSNVSSINVGNSVRWTAYVSGGNSNNYSIRWNGTDGLNGTGNSVNYRYNTPGQKSASVTVYANGRSATQYCHNTVLVVGYTNTYANTNELDIACAADPAKATVNQPVSWRTEVVGGFAPYTYSWTGSDGLSGTDSSVTKYYTKAGNKSAIVTVRSADGKTATRACSNSTTIRSIARAVAKPVPPPVQVIEIEPTDDLSAAALFSLKNVPWGWVAILIILVLFATIVYLIYNRPKI